MNCRFSKLLPSVMFFLMLSACGFCSSWQILNMGNGLPGNNITCFAVFNNKMAVGTDQGIGEYDGNRCEWKKVVLPDSLSQIQIRDLAYDSYGNLWFASSAGLGCVQKNGFEIMGTKDGLPTVDTERLQILKNEIFVGSFGGYVSKAFTPQFGRTSFTAVNYNPNQRDENLHIRSVGISGLAMSQSASGWISTKGCGMVLCEGLSQTTIDRAAGLESDWVEAFWVFKGQSKSEHMLVATTKGLDLFQDWKKVGNAKIPTKSEDTWLTCMAAVFNPGYPKARKGVNDTWDLQKFIGQRALWIGTRNEGIFRFENKKWTNYTPDNSVLPTKSINRIYSHRGRVIVCTTGGLVIIPLASNAFDEFKLIGLGSPNFKTIYPHLTMCPVNFLDKKADFWIVTEAGLSRFLGVTGISGDFLEGGENVSSSMEENLPEDQEQESASARPATLGRELKWERFYPENGTLFSKSIQGLAADLNGAAWLIFDKAVFARLRVKLLKNTSPDQANQRNEKYLWDFFKGTQVPWTLGTELTTLWFNDGKVYVGTKEDGFYILKSPEKEPGPDGTLKFEWDHFAQVEGLLRPKVIGFANRLVQGGENQLVLLHPDGITLWDGRRFQFVTLGSQREYTCIAGDLEGNIWTGSNGGGVFRLTPDMDIISYSTTNAYFESNRITSIVASTDPKMGKGISVWIACDQDKNGSDQPPMVLRGQVKETDIDGSSLHYYDGFMWDKWKAPGIRCMLVDGDYLFMGTNIRLRRFNIPVMVSD